MFGQTDTTPSPGGGSGSDPDEGNPIRDWSSTIGIVTAIVGNVLISFALNIQRYAHIRINREMERERVRMGWKRSGFSERNSGEDTGRVSGNYGTVADASAERARGNGRADDERLNGEGEDGRGGRSRHRPYSDDPVDDVSDEEAGPMRQSFLSDRTVTSLEKSHRSSDRKSYLRSPYWWTGIILMTIGEAGNFLAYGFAPASIVSPLGVVALISNCIIAPFMLKEKFRLRDLSGVIVAVAGAVTVVLSANTREEKIGPGDIWGMITRWEFELYLGLTVALILVLMWFSSKHGSKTILIDLGVVGLCGGYTALSTKGVSSLLSFTLWHVITFPITYVLVAVLVISAMMQIRYINKALQRFDSTQVIPTQFVLFTISVILGSAILYRDFESLTIKRGLQFFGGCALTFLGVYLITSDRSAPDDEESEEDEEEAIGLLNDSPARNWTDEPEQYHIHGQVDGAGASEPRQSRTHSLISDDDLSEDDEAQQTPRAPLSSSPISMPASLSDFSLTEPPGATPPQSLITNPWTRSHPEGLESIPPESTLPQARPSTPPPPTSSVLLQFPSAPGISDSPLKDSQAVSTTPQPLRRADTTTPRQRRHTLGRTPTTPRTSLTLRFSPGPLLPPLSGGLSAVVADSLRRGEGSPDRRRRDRRNSSRRPKSHLQPPATTESQTTPTTEVLETEYETDNSVVGGNENRYTDRESSRGRVPHLAPAPTFKPSSRSAAGIERARSANDGVADVPPPGRGRKDSWSENLARWSTSLRQSGRRWSRIWKDDHGDDHERDGQGPPLTPRSEPGGGTEAPRREEERSPQQP